ncbi:uncharacterized protein LOC120286788 isoform X2 [Eucalyptus grandis]|uniref:uncharacterized protein LOC120286788 isoform X2 n=1 Tax=Eucalyptus grandis TaxID=71139 RepID=UPI00192ECDF3|nr:uncharacterized protein LOC120286788 isoform X2 [Eucalyptus grandis]
MLRSLLFLIMKKRKSDLKMRWTPLEGGSWIVPHLVGWQEIEGGQFLVQDFVLVLSVFGWSLRRIRTWTCLRTGSWLLTYDVKKLPTNNIPVLLKMRYES